jgi:hypothetical protein
MVGNIVLGFPSFSTDERTRHPWSTSAAGVLSMIEGLVHA